MKSKNCDEIEEVKKLLDDLYEFELITESGALEKNEYFDIAMETQKGPYTPVKVQVTQK